jgi:uncharacterized damage-inducible protein DinB
MTDLDEHGRPEPPLAGDETDTLRGFLDLQRSTFAWKCAGLDSKGLQASVAPSTMTLGGMMKHLALVEESWFGDRLRNQDARPPWDAIDWGADPDWEWRSAADDSPEQLRGQWDASVVYANAMLDEALSEGGVEQMAQRKLTDGCAPSLRWILCHMIEEYARHNGHADLIRESIDGETGE